MTVNRIARWDGSAWLPFGTGISGGSFVLALTTLDADGAGPQPAQLVAGGNFFNAGGVTVNYIARWDGSAWLPFGTGMNLQVNALTTWDPDGAGRQSAQLVAGGFFTTAGGVPSRYIASWGCPGVACLRGDSNGDDGIDFRDIDCFVSALVSEAAWLGCTAGLDAATYLCANDCNCNGGVDRMTSIASCNASSPAIARRVRSRRRMPGVSVVAGVRRARTIPRERLRNCEAATGS